MDWPCALTLATLASAAPTLDVPRLERECGSGKAAACARLAEVYAHGEGVARSPGRAARLYKKACDAQDADACFTLGVLWTLGEGVVAADDERGNRLLDLACKLGQAEACGVVVLGRLLEPQESPDPSRRDVEREAHAQLVKLCDLGYAQSCQTLSSSDANDEWVLTDPARAPMFWKRAVSLRQRDCGAGAAHACLELAQMYSPPSSPSERRPAGSLDLTQSRKYRLRAEALLQAACAQGNMGSDGCVGLGELHVANHVVSYDFERAFAALKKACGAGFYEGCFNLQILSGLYNGSAGSSGKDESKLARIRKACGKSEACGWPAPRLTAPEDQPLGDDPGSTEIRDRLVAMAFDKEAPLDDRFDAAETVARMGFPGLVAPILERSKVHETHRDMLTVRVQTENDQHRLLDEGRSPSREDVEALANEALKAARHPNDAWGRPLRAKVIPRDGKGFSWDVDILSDGPDSRPGTEDDLSTAEPTWVYDPRRYPTLDFSDDEQAARSAPHLEARCRSPQMGADDCRDLARMYVAGRGVPKDPVRAVELYTRACEGFAEACDEAGQLLSAGQRLPKDPEKAGQLLARARKRFEASCFPTMTTQDVCLRLAQMYERGEGGPSDPAQALVIYREFCPRKVPEACQAIDRLR